LWERVAARQRGRVRGSRKLCRKNPSSDADFVRATFSHKGRRKEEGIAAFELTRKKPALFAEGGLFLE
jgi:hypothetical protein